MGAEWTVITTGVAVNSFYGFVFKSFWQRRQELCLEGTKHLAGKRRLTQTGICRQFPDPTLSSRLRVQTTTKLPASFICNTELHEHKHSIHLSIQSNYFIRTHGVKVITKLAEKPVVAQLAKKFFAFCSARKFITVSIRVHRLLRFTFPPSPVTSRFVVILSSHIHPGIPSGLLRSTF